MLRQNLLWHSSLFTELIQKQEAFSSLYSALPRLGCQGISLWFLQFGSHQWCLTLPSHWLVSAATPTVSPRGDICLHCPALLGSFLGLAFQPDLLRAKMKLEKTLEEYFVRTCSLMAVQPKSGSFSGWMEGLVKKSQPLLGQEQRCGCCKLSCLLTLPPTPPSPPEAHLYSNTRDFWKNVSHCTNPCPESIRCSSLSWSWMRALCSPSKPLIPPLLPKLPLFINSSESKCDPWKKMFLLFWFSTKRETCSKLHSMPREKSGGKRCGKGQRVNLDAFKSLRWSSSLLVCTRLDSLHFHGKFVYRAVVEILEAEKMHLLHNLSGSDKSYKIY